jgi:Reverse transcriptase (RNA-dependent DNA polymerase)
VRRRNFSCSFEKSVDQLLRRLNEAHLWAQGFADDVVILINGQFLNTVRELLQTAMNIVQNWCSELESFVNADKTTTVLLTNKSLRIGFKKPKLFGQEN